MKIKTRISLCVCMGMVAFLCFGEKRVRVYTFDDSGFHTFVERIEEPVEDSYLLKKISRQPIPSRSNAHKRQRSRQLNAGGVLDSGISRQKYGYIGHPSLIGESHVQDGRNQTNSSIYLENFRAEMIHRSHQNGHFGVRGVVLGCPECDEARQQDESQQEDFDDQKREANRRGENGVWAQKQQWANDEMATRAALRMLKQVKKGRRAPTQLFNIKPAVANPW